MGALRELPHSYIKIGKRFRKDLGDLSSLTESIRTVGLLQRIVVDKNHNLIVGHRRFEAYKLAKPDSATVPVIVVDTLEDATARLIAERDENTCRKEMATSELLELGKALEKLELKAAKDRQGTRTDIMQPVAGSPGTTRDKVGEALGISGETYRRLKTVADDPEALERIDKGESSISKEYDAQRGAAKRDWTEANARRTKKPPAELPGAVGNLRAIPKRKSPSFLLQRISEQLEGYADELEKIDVTQINTAEAESLAGSLSRTRAVLSKTINQLRSIA